MKAIKEIVDIISDKLSYSTPDFDKDLVGMRVRLQALEARLEIGSPGVRMVGIWGIGGSGKTTIASSLHMKISHHFQSHCIVNDIGTEKLKNSGLTKLQEKLISGLLKFNIELQSVAHGKQIIRTRLSHRNVLIILDDVDDIDQLDALVGSHDWFGPGSRIIITTRNEQLLISHKVDHVFQATLLSPEEAIQLFSKRVYNKDMRVKDYEELSKSVVSYCAGLPLALQILGSFLCGKDEKEWRCTLDRLKRIPEEKIVEKLRISYDGLKASEKQLFLDIACFFRKKKTLDAIQLFEACVQEMGHYIVKGDYPNDPEKHTRVWEYENLMLLEGATEENDNIEAIQVARDYSFRGVCKIISNMKKLRSLRVIPIDFNCDIPTTTCDDHWEGPDFLSNELRYIEWTGHPLIGIIESFQQKKRSIMCLSVYKHLPHLKVLLLDNLHNLLGTPDFEGLPCLQTLKLHECQELQEIHPSIGKHKSLEYISVHDCFMVRMFPTIISMGNLKTLDISYSYRFKEMTDFRLEFPEIKTNMISLVELSLENVNIDVLLSSSIDRCANLRSLHLVDCCFPNSKEVIFDGLKHLKDLRIRGSTNGMPTLVDEETPSEIGELSNLRELDLGSNEFTRLHFSLSKLTRLKLLNLSGCDQLVELPELPSSLAILNADHCPKLKAIGDSHKHNKWLCQVSLTLGATINDVHKLLESMLQEGNAVENQNILLKLGFQNAKVFGPLFVIGGKYTLQLTEDWCNKFSGFLMCFASYEYERYAHINMERVISGMESEDGEAWEEGDSPRRYTEVWYVSFASLRHTKWWDETCNKAVSFSGHIDLRDHDRVAKSGFGVRLVARKSGSGPTAQEESEFSHYTPKFCIRNDSANALGIRLTKSKFSRDFVT
ncbi:hypothetical protein SSX86_016099 [Deinandra increscens subsp. villosa]|uniref:NB-ARC domain-containing protein n=1 Tax=Deinandra increscens subsp. villosa TaxID=3103831 RepID=A0AAP0D235_9ASTR